MNTTIRRRNLIVKTIKRNGSVDVDELVKQFEVSVETIRRDLRYLDERGLIKRTYGGAVKREQSTWDMPFNERILFQQNLKEAMTASTLIALPAIIGFLFIERHLKDTMAISGIKE